MRLVSQRPFLDASGCQMNIFSGRELSELLPGVSVVTRGTGRGDGVWTCGFGLGFAGLVNCCHESCRV